MLVEGDLDTNTAAELLAVLLGVCRDTSTIVLDLGAVTLIHSAGLRALLNAKAICAEYCVELVIVPSAQPPPRRVHRRRWRARARHRHAQS